MIAFLEHRNKLGDSRAIHAFLLVGIFLLAFHARVWEFGTLPPGLNQDEASIGIEAFDLYHFGLDRNGIPYPVNFVSWGNGMDALYGYVLIPFVAFELNPVTVRLPALLSGILTIPLSYFVASRTLGTRVGLMATFLLAISPWHILLSRWGINENILPFVFLVGYAFILKSSQKNHGFIIGCIFLGLCLYVYGATYVSVPVFMLCVLLLTIRFKRVSVRSVLLGIFTFVVLAFPLVLFVLINSLNLDSIRLGFLTVPRLPSEARYQSMGVIFRDNLIQGLIENVSIALNLLLNQSDGLVWNVVEPYGYLYKLTFPLAIIGAIFLFPFSDSARAFERLLLLSWLLAGFAIGFAQPVNINRFNLIFIPLIFCVTYCWAELGKYSKFVQVGLACFFLVGYLFFTRDYHGENYRSQADKVFFTGLIPALDHARQMRDNPICVTNRVNMAYVFVLFTERFNPVDYLGTIEYEDPRASFRAVRSLDRYLFGVDACIPDSRNVYVLSAEEELPESDIEYQVNSFHNFRVYVPKSHER